MPLGFPSSDGSTPKAGSGRYARQPSPRRSRLAAGDDGEGVHEAISGAFAPVAEREVMVHKKNSKHAGFLSLEHSRRRQLTAVNSQRAGQSNLAVVTIALTSSFNRSNAVLIFSL